MSGNFSPSDGGNAFLGRDDFKESLCKGTLKFILREEEHTYSVFSGITDLQTVLLSSCQEEGMGDLKKNAYAVADFSACIFSCSVLKLFNYGECIVHYGIFGNTVDLYNGTYSAGIMFSVV